MKRLSRRTLLGATTVGAAGAATAILTGCDGEDEPSADDQAEALNDALAIELGAVVVYGAASQALEGPALETAERFAEQEREHADALRLAIEELGATPVEPLSGAEYAEELGLEALEDDEQYLQFTAELENAAIGAYNAAIATVVSTDVRRTLLTALATDAEHLSVLLGELEQPQVPDAFVFGTAIEATGP